MDSKPLTKASRIAAQRRAALAPGKSVVATPQKTDMPVKKKFFKSLPCVHRHELTGDVLPCQTCTKTVEVPIYNCDLFVICSEDKLVKTADGLSVPCCRICKEYKT